MYVLNLHGQLYSFGNILPSSQTAAVYTAGQLVTDTIHSEQLVNSSSQD